MRNLIKQQGICHIKKQYIFQLLNQSINELGLLLTQKVHEHGKKVESLLQKMQAWTAMIILEVCPNERKIIVKLIL